MTDGRPDDGNYLVQVRAQVMTRDDSSGGWVPMEGGGLSHVSVRKRILPPVEDSKHEYLICGTRISDQLVVLSCTIKKDFQYHKVMPTFHHWRTGNKKFGLTFQTARDACDFAKGVRLAVEDLLEGTLEFSQIHDPDVGDDDVFMAVDLPAERGDSQSSSGSSSVGGGLLGLGGEPVSSPYAPPHANHHYLHRMHFVNRPSRPPSNNNNGGLAPEPEVWVKSEERPKDKAGEWDRIETISEPYSYVHFALDRPAVHEYSYPVVDPLKGPEAARRDGGSGEHKLKGGEAGLLPPPPRLPTKSRWRRAERKREKLKHMLQEHGHCKHCQEPFSEEDNARGSCEYAPDCMRSCIDTVTCLACAQCMLYHCMADAEGDYAQHPCACDRQDEHCGRRWLGLAILSFFVPCLWCYLPMSTCHRCGVGYGVCGGRHEAS